MKKKYNLLKLNIFVLFFLLLNFAPSLLVSQIPPHYTIKRSYFTPSVGLIYYNYRDFATSPLFYSGVGSNVSFAWLRQREKAEVFVDINCNFGTSSADAPISDYFQTTTESFFVSNNLNFQYLYNLKPFSNIKNDFKIGGVFLTTTNYRLNSSLMNNGVGFENLSNIMLACKYTRDLSRTETKVKNLLFFKRPLKKVTRNISFQLNLGLANSNYRPGYAYSYIAEIDGSQTDEFSSILDNYELSFNGWRLGCQIDFTKFRQSGNGHKWSYIWDVVSAPGKFEPYQMATHRIQYTLIINRN